MSKLLLPSIDTLSDHVESILSSGPPPVYIGFGSNPVSKPEKFIQIFNEVSVKTKHRLIIAKGWADLPENNTSNILFVDEMPFEKLFPRLAAIVYHGGTGTMAAATRAGIPQVAFPFMADQFENHKQIVKLGLGPKACNFKNLTADILATTINECIENDKYKKNTIKIAESLNKTNGLELTIGLIESELNKQTSG